MNIFLTGASGFIGQHILKACLEAGHNVIACVRNTERIRHYFPTAQFVRGNFAMDQKASDWLPRLRDIDVVINAVGIIRQQGTNTFDAIHHKAACALFKACEQSKVKKVIQISALGADDTAFSEYHRSKKAADDFLSQLNIDWVIMMPSIVYGPGAKSMALFKAMAALPWTPLVYKGDQTIQPIQIDDLTRALLTTITDNAIHHCRIPMVGPKPITIKMVYNLLKHWLGIRTRYFIPIPYTITLIFARLAGFLGNTPINTDTVKMLKNGNTGDVQPFIDIFGFTPVSLKQVLLQHPPNASDIVYSKQYFLLTLLRITLALLWIVTGIVSAFVFPIELSYTMLAQVGIPESSTPIALYFAAGLDIGLGTALLTKWNMHLVVTLQILVIIGYSLVIAIALPEYWIHPFGPVTKNVPLIVATLMLLTTEK